MQGESQQESPALSGMTTMPTVVARGTGAILMYNTRYHVWSLTFFPFKCHCYYCVVDRFFCKIIKSYIFVAAAVVLLLNGSPNKQHLKSHNPIKHTQDTSTDSVEHQWLDPSYGTSSNTWTPGALYEGHYVYLYEHWHQAADEWASDGGAAEANQQMHWGETWVRHGTHVEVYRYRTEFSTLSVQNWIKRCRQRLVLELWGPKKRNLLAYLKGHLRSSESWGNTFYFSEDSLSWQTDFAAGTNFLLWDHLNTNTSAITFPLTPLLSVWQCPLIHGLREGMLWLQLSLVKGRYVMTGLKFALVL